MEERVDDVFEKISGTAENAINECASVLQHLQIIQ